MRPPVTALRTFFLRGLQSAFFLRVTAHDLRITPLHLLLILLIGTAASILMGRLVISGAAEFYPKAFLWGWSIVILQLWLIWFLSDQAQKRGFKVQVAALFALGLTQTLALEALSTVLYLALIQPQALDGSIWHWILYIGMSIWGAIAYWLLVVRTTRSQGKLIVLAGLVAFAVPLTVHVAEAPMYWLPQQEEVDSEADLLQLTPSSLETQLTLASRQRLALKPERPGVTDLFSISYAPYEEDVFLRESSMVNAVIEERFDAAGHTQELVNSPTTLETLPWASLENLERAIKQAGDVMDTEHDVLLIYLTSHGGKNGELAAKLWPLEMDPLTPQTLNLWLDKAGIRNRVIVVSACYAGSWIAPLMNDYTLIMTAADASHTSYGCGSGSELTFFGRAVFDEALRETYSFEQAFKQALPVIRQREIEGDKQDGFSNPQIFVGAKIRPVLQQLQPAPQAAGH